MELTFIGTGSILTARMSASALVDGKLLIDTPNGAMKAIRRAGIDLMGIDVCLITHFHADHFFDIVFLFLEQGLFAPKERGLVLIGPTGFEERVKQLFELSYPGTWETVSRNTSPRFIEFGEEGGEWSGNGYRIRALPMKHTTPIALGYSIVDEAGARLGYTGDTVHCPGVEELASSSSVLVLDTSFPHEKAGHMGLDDVEGVASRWPDLQLIATHLGDEVTGSSKPNIAFPSDGQTFQVPAA
ncbi:MBL fold metallo-hydrolase [Nonomuraea sp. NPDC049709]|uniref:MBL fold metallo-hydrolase n=1 Tax=Nonomuraea sp. NPDC049709 TaxID=3154736 RepID=UPI00341ACC97